MTTLEEESDCQTDIRNDVLPMDTDFGLYFALNDSGNVLFNGYYNGIGVEVRSEQAMDTIYKLGCFGKGSSSRSRPTLPEPGDIPILRRRQYLKRTRWLKMYNKNQSVSEADQFLKNIVALTSEIIKDKSVPHKDIVDLVSSDEDDSTDNTDETVPSFSNLDNAVIVVPNSESEDDNYFADLKPKCCLNKTKLREKLMLTAQEAFFLMYGLGCLQVFNGVQALSIEDCWDLFSKDDSRFVHKYVVYHYYRSKGYVVRPGIQYGGDYLLYKPGGPEKHHAKFVVIIRFKEYSYNWISVLNYVRVANTTSKQVIMAEVIKSNKPTLQLPQDLCEYSVREVLLDRNLPVSTINEELD